MGKAVIHAGGAGNGQAAKICNNMMLGIQMISVCEAMVLAQRLGLAPERLFEISRVSSGQCWSLTSYCPVPGPVPASPANRDYQPGFTTAMMLKDLKLAQAAAPARGRQHALGCGSLPALQPVRGERERRAGFFRHNQDDRRRSRLGLCRHLPAGGTAAMQSKVEADVKEQYLISIRLIERLHRRFLDVIKAELDRLGIEDINNVQTLILFNINEEQLTVGELTVRGYYLGSNVSYNVKKLVENDYLIQERSSHDRRMTRVRLSPKGLDLTARISELYQRNSEELSGKFVGEEQLRQTNQALMSLERYWSSQISYGPAFGMIEPEE